jgi:iron complex transport system substrate-binding protein
MRVVSLLPAATEIVAELGAADCLVGISHECDYPPEVTSLPRVTRSRIGDGQDPGAIDQWVREASNAGEPLYEIDDALIAELEPDVILGQGTCPVCAVRLDDVRALAERLHPVPIVQTVNATTLDDVLDDIAMVAEVLERSDEADELVAGLRERLHRVHVRLKGAATPRPRVAVLEWTDPIFIGGHWVPQMVRRAGGVDVLGTADEPARTVTIDELVAAAPERLVFAPCGYSLPRAVDEARRLLARPDWRWAAALPAWAVDANAFLSRPGPRLVTGVELLAQIFHPGVFTPPLPSRAVAVAGGPRSP